MMEVRVKRSLRIGTKLGKHAGTGMEEKSVSWCLLC